MRLKKLTSIAVIGLLAYVLADEAWAQTTSCSTTAASFTESFDTVDYRDDATSASGWGSGAVKLQFKGNSFNSTSQTIGEAVFVAGAGDFDGDGWVDLAAIILSPNRLHFLKNLGINADGSHKGFYNGGVVNSAGWKAQVIDAAPPGLNGDGPAVYTGDFDGDGDPDVMYMKTNDQSKPGTIDNAYAYRNDGTNAASLPIFTRIDFSAFFKASGASYHRTTTWGTVIDWDKDGQDDFICTSSHSLVNEVLLFRSKTPGKIDFANPISLVPDIGLVGPFADATHAFNAAGCLVPSQQGKYYSQGGSSIAVGDLDGDGDFDIVVGSVNEVNLKYWRNDGSDVFTKMPDIPWAAQGLFVPGAPTFIIIGDFDGDGDGDIVTGRDGYYCNGFQGTAWFFANNGNGTTFVQRTTPLLNAGADLDFGVKLFIDENIKYPNLNKNPDMTLDLIAADGNNSGQYYPVLGQRSNVYNTQNKAYSKIIDALDNNGNAIVSAQMSGLSQSLPSGTTIDYLVSNDNGATWEQLTPEEVYTSGSAKAHTFTHFGSDFRFQAVLNAPPATLTGDEKALAPGSKTTPVLNQISFLYNYVTRREYSRSNLAYASNLSVTSSASGSTKNAKSLVFSSTFFYPGYEGTLRAYDTSVALATTTETNNDLNQAVVKSGIGSAVFWDAGDILRGTSAGARTLYTSLPKNSTTPDLTALSRLSFIASNASQLSTTMATDDDTASKIISFVRAGMGSSNGTKLYDVGHSSPVFVGAPVDNTSDPSLTADNYTSFVTAQVSRQPAVYIGSNSGMVHAFNAQTGAELWAYVPYNLLAKLKTQMSTNAAGAVSYEHKYMVDGAVVVRDVFDRDQSRWRTVLIAGEALGQGRGDNNYYFALDVTDPANPLPLWEFTDAWIADSMSCSGSYTQNVCTTTTPQTCSNSCTQTNHVFTTSPANVPANWIAVEAEDFGSNKALDAKSAWTASVVPTGYYSTGAMAGTTTSTGNTCKTGTSSNITTCGAILSYAISVSTPGDYQVMIRYSATASKYFRYQLGALDEIPKTSVTTGAWSWYVGAKVALVANSYNLQLDLVDTGVSIDKILVVPFGQTAPADNTPTEYCATQCTSGTPVTTCVDKPFNPSAESYECGTGTGYKCCQDTSSSSYFCAPVGQSCDTIDTVLGQTWSQPVVAPVKLSSNRRWLTMFASGYNNRTSLPAAVGRSAYAIDTISGKLIGQWDYNDVTYNKASNPSTIDNTIPGGISVFDYTTTGTDDTPDGYADVAYLGDLEGRLWKIDLTRDATAKTNATVPLNTWPTCVMFDAADPDKTSSRDWAPIITTPAVTTITADSSPHKPIVYFGTGGDDRAPSVPTRLPQYRFYAIKDTVTCPASPTPTYTTALTQSVVFAADNAAHYQWIVGDGKDVNNATLALSTSEGTVGQRYWSDPVIFNNSIVYFASLGGSIESVNPCDNLTDSSLLFGYAIRPIRDSDGRAIPAGTSTVQASLNSGAYYRSASKIRRAVLTAGQAPTAGVAQAPSATGGSSVAAGTQIFIQTFDGNVRAITPPTIKDTNTIRVLRWREIPLY